VAAAFGAALTAVFGAAFELVGVWAYADNELAEKATAKAMMKIDLMISPLKCFFKLRSATGTI
jgi:hypothetical protein